ncbi:glycosyltransferase family 2 protein, partial [Candidatus Azambacteria bacterium]|nr:glycosyltransferase family 2 protein [Candidatus Azambacteria bacterium]
AFFIIIFDIYWLIKTIYLSIHLKVAYRKIMDNTKIDWINKLANLSDKQKTIKKNWPDLYHLIILPVYQENYEMIKLALQALVDDDYPKEKMIVVLAPEFRSGPTYLETARQLENEFKNKFFQFLLVIHPADLPNEIPGKGSNINFAGQTVQKKIIDPLQINYDDIIVSAFDIDTRAEKGYFACLTYNFLTTKNPLKSSYQPIPLYINNIWPAPSFSKIVAFSATFWHMIQQERPERLTTFSSHSMPFRALVEVGFWQKNVVSEDSRIFWQFFLYYNGDWRVQPIYYPVKMDALIAPTVPKTLINLYKQQRRWGFGVENIPYFIFAFTKNKLIPLKKKLYFSLTIIEGFHSWATNALIIFLFGWLPLILGGTNFKTTLISYNLPIMTRNIMIFAMIGLISSAILTINLLPTKPEKHSKLIYIWMFFQWLLLPYTIIFLGSFPALESQTRLMFKKYLGFWVTPKD